MRAVDLVVLDLELRKRLCSRSSRRWFVGVRNVPQLDEHIESGGRCILDRGVRGELALRVSGSAEGEALVLSEFWRSFKSAFGDVPARIYGAVVIALIRVQAVYQDFGRNQAVSDAHGTRADHMVKTRIAGDLKCHDSGLICAHPENR